jgi:8-oxo-dGTP diphosphatase
MLKFDPFTDPQPAYLYMAESVAGRIQSGEFTWQLPSERKLIKEYGVAYMTMRHGMEVLRERGLVIPATVHCRNTDTDTRVGLFFQAAAKDPPQDAPFNAEPHKCAKIAWYPMAMRPATTMPYSALGISLYQRKDHFGTIGW